MPSLIVKPRAMLAEKGLPELILDQKHPRFLTSTVIDNRILWAVNEMATELAANPKARVSTDKMAKKYHVATEDLRDVWKDYKAEDRDLTSAQEDLLCHRLDRLTRYGGKAKASEEPIEVEVLVEKYTIGVLRLLEHSDSRVNYSLQSQWVAGFLGRRPGYRVMEDGPLAPEESTHPTTSATDPWLLPHEKATLYSILEKHYPIRSSKGLEEYWKTVKRSARQQIGYEFFDLSAQNETLQRKHRSQPPTSLAQTALGKRKRDSAEAERTVDWRVWDTACNDFLSVDMAIWGKVATPPCSPPPGFDTPVEEEQANYDTTATMPRAAMPGAALPHAASSITHAHPSWPPPPQGYTPAPFRGDNGGYYTLDDPYRGTIPTADTAGATYDSEDQENRVWNAMGFLARAAHPNAAATSRLYDLPERLLREKWATRKHRKTTTAARLLKEQERRLHQRLQNLVLFGGNVMPVEASKPDGTPANIVNAYADAVLAEDDQLVECNLVVHANWGAEFIDRNPRYSTATSGLRP